MPTAQISNTLSLEYEIEGSGIPLLLIMGVGGQLVQWPPDFRAALIRQGFQLILVDNRDAGLSSKMSHLGVPNIGTLFWRQAFGLSIESPYLLEDMAQDYRLFLNHMGLSQCHVVGISMGSMIAQILAADHPEYVSSVTLMHTGTGKRRHGLSTKPKALQALAKRGKMDNADDYADYFAHLFSVVGSPNLQRSPDVLREAGRALYERGHSPDGFKRQFAAILATGDRESYYARIQQPCSVINGYADPLLPIAGAKAVERAIPQAMGYYFDDLGHDLPEKYSSIFAAIIKQTSER
jgi:proline iminopeptidase